MTGECHCRLARRPPWLLGALWLLLAVLATPAWAQSRLGEFLAKVSAAELVPGADHFAAPQGNPPVAVAMAGERRVGFAFVNADWVNSTGTPANPSKSLSA